MKILITGANGFIGKNLQVELSHQGHQLFLFDKDTDESLLQHYCEEAEFIFHLAGVNRPENPEDFMKGNFGFTSKLLEMLKTAKNTCPVMVSSSIQAERDNLYGESKLAGEKLLLSYGQETGARVLVYRLPNVFGKWSRPNYNSVVATFCHNIARDLPITIHDPESKMQLVYIDDVLTALSNALKGQECKEGAFCIVPMVYEVTVGHVAELLREFKATRDNKMVPNMGNAFEKKLYSTYLSYLPTDEFSYPLKMHEDHRGSFTEFIKTVDRGQVSINVSKPGITKGNHWHHTKTEKFLVVQGQGVIRFRKIDGEKILTYKVSGNHLEVVDIPPGYTHNIENLGTEDMVTVMWANELLDKEQPDTYFMEV